MSVLLFQSRGPAIQRPEPKEELLITRLRVDEAADWQLAIVEECRRQRTLTPSVFNFLKEQGLLDRCTFLASEGMEQPLVFRYIGGPTVRFLGRAWARQQIGKPDLDDPHQVLAEGVGQQYREAIEGGDPVFNRVTITGLSASPKVYTHMLYGWAPQDGRRALLSCLHEF
ncbi:hypothetical protein [Azospirillum rugosum]|uniref:Uncharacterized protein n=1 Tax=Azospirillum rugosum TaxID=416170 RepID=A0ABS4SEP9_9PROT|nr:hypothetical protein [Azospirillum rugosum]MBP2291061.1 hypothetical protein [Azospirillum rugosum]MDQ0524875.1 hypothetical protein [Azospirillum rugosum]